MINQGLPRCDEPLQRGEPWVRAWASRGGAGSWYHAESGSKNGRDVMRSVSQGRDKPHEAGSGVDTNRKAALHQSDGYDADSGECISR